MALRRLGNLEDAEDAVQDALFSACQHISQFEGRSQMSTWLNRIVINSARMQLRRRPACTILSLDQTDEEQKPVFEYRLVDCGPSPEELCKTAELRGIIRRLMKSLSPKLRDAFQLCEIDGLSLAEAARLMGTRKNTLKSQLSRARIRLGLLLLETIGGGHRVAAGVTSRAE
jgi:RNA polymerase sigma-70 factor (ECF subfamily)